MKQLGKSMIPNIMRSISICSPPHKTITHRIVDHQELIGISLFVENTFPGIERLPDASALASSAGDCKSDFTQFMQGIRKY
jgi:hypothetical protein